MRPNRTELRARRGLAQKLWEFADELTHTAEEIRYANKPADLTYPIAKILQMVRRLDVFKDQWLIRCIKTGIYSLDRWPKLWERYL